MWARLLYTVKGQELRARTFFTKIEFITTLANRAATYVDGFGCCFNISFMLSLVDILRPGTCTAFKISKKSGSNPLVWIASWVLWGATSEITDCAAGSPWVPARKPMMQSCRSDLESQVRNLCWLQVSLNMSSWCWIHGRQVWEMLLCPNYFQDPRHLLPPGNWRNCRISKCSLYRP